MVDPYTCIMEYPSICEDYVGSKNVCIFFVFLCVCVGGGDFFWYTVYFQCFTEGFLTQGIVSLICTVFLMGKKESHRKEVVGWIVIGSCHRILGKIMKNRSSNNHQTNIIQ